MTRMVLAASTGDRDRVLGERGETEAIGNSETFTVDLRATDDPDALGQVDVVFLGLKAYSYASARTLVGTVALAKARRGGPTSSYACQITRASSVNASASRAEGGTSVPRSWKPRRRFWMKACAATMTLAVRSRFSPRIGPIRAFRRPWSVSMRLFAFTSVSWKAAKQLIGDAGIDPVPIGGRLH